MKKPAGQERGGGHSAGMQWKAAPRHKREQPAQNHSRGTWSALSVIGNSEGSVTRSAISARKRGRSRCVNREEPSSAVFAAGGSAAREG